MVGNPDKDFREKKWYNKSDAVDVSGLFFQRGNAMSEKFNFDEVINRRNTNSYKWNVKENELPMWVADMDFQAAPCILEAMEKRMKLGVFGYADLPDEWYEAYQYWWKNYHDFSIEKDWLIFTTGVIPAISTTVRKFTTPAEKVVIQTPVYNMFYNSILNNGRVVLENPLKFDGTSYEMDFEDLEKKLSDPLTTLMILCNPHNPVGKIWKKEELAKVGELCKKHHVLVLSDEIHCDLCAPGMEYTPFASVSQTCKEISITAIAPTKAFNIAGLQTAAVVAPNKGIRDRIWRALNTDEVAEPNAFAVDVAVAAFMKGRSWNLALREYLQENKEITDEFLKEHLPKVTMISKDATYLLWLDVSAYTDNSEALAGFIREKTGLFVSHGMMYHGNGNHFLRFNVACPKETLYDGLERLKNGLEQWK